MRILVLVAGNDLDIAVLVSCRSLYVTLTWLYGLKSFSPKNMQQQNIHAFQVSIIEEHSTTGERLIKLSSINTESVERS